MMEEINDNNNNNHYDVIVLGAGISGIDAVYYLQKYCPWAKILVLERRENIGGTWDFFKYPGIRSDSDMYTFGFSWKLWKADNPIATAGQILKYLNEAVNEQHIREKIKFNTNVEQASLQASAAIMCICKAYPTALQSGNSNTGRNSLQRMSREGNINSIDRICSSLAIACGRVQSMPNAANAAGEAVMNFSIFNQLKSVIMNDFGIHFIFIFLTMCCTLTLCHFSIQSFLW